MRSLLLLTILLGSFAPLLAQSPALSDQEKLRIENLNLKAQLAQVAVKLEQVEAESAACQLKLSAPEFEKLSEQLVKDIEAGHPGYSFDPKSGTFAPKKPE